ncbi:PSPA7_2676 family Cys-rich small protein [Pseudomonas sp. NPDC090233]
MTLVCLLRGCHWRAMANPEIVGLHCQHCERCGALRYCQPGQPLHP